MNTVKITVGINNHEYSDNEITGYCTDLSVAMKRLGLEVENTRESVFSWIGYFDNPYRVDKRTIHEYLVNVQPDLFKVKVQEVSK